MNETRRQIENIFSEIEPEDSGNSLTAEEVKNILLGKEKDEESPVVEETPLSGTEELRHWAETNNQIYHIGYYNEIKSHRKVLGRIVVFFKKVIRKMLFFLFDPILRQQSDFNASVTASINVLYNENIVMHAALDEYKNEIKKLNGRIDEVISRLTGTENSIKSLEMDLMAENPYTAIDYEKFENHFRGSETEIKKRLSMYLPYFEGKNNVIDLGCGRGELLELLKENHIHARGVDMYKPFVEYCNNSGLNVVYGNAIEFVYELDDDTVEAIFAAQLIEHIKITELVRLCNESYKKLKEGGCLILETPNPTCLAIYTNAFYVDPSHNKPVHPKLLEYILQEAGFEDVQIVFTECSKVGYSLPFIDMEYATDPKEKQNLKDINDGIGVLSNIMFGSQDYAIIATKKSK